jgi:hypothetical protein
MAKKKQREEDSREFDVYKQSDGALIVLDSSETPDDADAELVWNGEAKNERDAIKQARKSDAALKKAPVADSVYDPDIVDTVRKDQEDRVNARLGINPRAGKKKSAKAKTSAAKSRAKKSVRKSAKKASSRKK